GSVNGVREGDDNGLSITNSGSIGSVYAAAVYVHGPAPITNTGTIKARHTVGSNTFSTSADGIDLNSGTHGTYTNTVTNTGANALIFGDWNGIYAKQNLDVTNSGSIRGYLNFGVAMNAGSVSNSNYIEGSYYGIRITSSGSVNNSGGGSI